MTSCHIARTCVRNYYVLKTEYCLQSCYIYSSHCKQYQVIMTSCHIAKICVRNSCLSTEYCLHSCNIYGSLCKQSHVTVTSCIGGSSGSALMIHCFYLGPC